ncbi:uncharacterized protein LOC115406342 isoform X2 [Salarias fasciatus]|uniref:THAP domain-containing protein 1 n=1 Tax=Salarias fasciatus TaxID=181472 RepID=A0A672IM86_SALFA|nr:uncharacterized protein LOC115406342 isoform X2 [Salarias fasciatus]
MPSFNFLDNLENYLLTGKYPPNATKSVRKVTRAASKNFIHKGGVLWRSYRGRLLRVVRSDEEIREVLTRYHDENNHAGRVRAVKEIMLMYYWVGVTEAVKNWIQACEVCRNRAPMEPPAQPVLYCLVYGCDASSYSCPELTFHRFPKDLERRAKWLALAQRDEGSLRLNSYICSRHFEPYCFTLGDGDRLVLTKDAVPTVLPVTVRDEELPVPSEEDFLQSTTLDDLLSTAAAAAETISSSDLPFDSTDAPAGLHEHQYSLPESGEVEDVSLRKRKTTIEPTFTVYNQIARYLSHRVLPVHGKKSSGAFKRMAKRFGLVDGVLMYTRVTPALRVPRSKEEVNSILQQFHNNQGHNGQSMCQREISKHFYWGSMTRDLSRWISSCHTCVHRTKRKWLRCSVYNCTNCCGPVERGLGLTFHNFPLNNTALLAQWLKAVGRSHWHPRLRSSICSTHFTDDCFDRSGDKVVLRPDAVPTLVVHTESSTVQSVQPPPGEEVYFAKYDAVELYLTSRTYPPGLSYVEKNTFRRFCKKFAIKDGVLHMVRGDRLRLVLRSRQQVESALTDYHDELNHLDVNKCLRLLNERYFWKTMRPDVAQWINNCSHCSMKKGKKPEKRAEAGECEAALQTLMSPLHDSDSLQDDSDDCYADDGDAAERPAANLFKTVVKHSTPFPSKAASSHAARPPFPIVLRLTAPVVAQPNASVVLQQQPSNSPPAARARANRTRPGTGTRTATPQQTGGGPAEEAEPQLEEGPAPPASQTESSGCESSAGTDGGKTPPTEPPPSQPASPSGEPRSQRTKVCPAKRTKDPDAGPAAKRSASGGLEPVVAPSTKPWPVFTIAGPAQVQIVKQSPEADSLAVSRRSRKLQARVVVQQCSQAKVKTRPGLDGAEAQWAQIEDGMVVYVCFFHGAAENVVYEIANSLMTTKLFRRDSRHLVSVLDRPGSVLLVPQDSLIGEALPGRRLRFRDSCELWWGAQLFSGLASACRELMAGSARCAKGGVRVEQGVYGQKQEIVLSSAEPQTLLLEF